MQKHTKAVEIEANRNENMEQLKSITICECVAQKWKLMKY